MKGLMKKLRNVLRPKRRTPICSTRTRLAGGEPLEPRRMLAAVFNPLGGELDEFATAEVAPYEVIDDGDAGFTTVGDWTTRGDRILGMGRSLLRSRRLGGNDRVVAGRCLH